MALPIYNPFYIPAKNEIDAKSAYYARSEYKEGSVIASRARHIDLWYSKSLYGKINILGDAVINLEESTLKSLPGADQPIFAIDFVADAFEDFRDYYINGITNRLVESTIGPIKEIRPLRAWENVHTLYSEHLDEMKDYFIETYLIPNNDKIVDVKDVFRYCEKFFYNHAKDFPLTFSAFILSTNCPTHTSGLLIELPAGSNAHGDDELKTSILQASSFEKFAAVATRFGFFVDKNAPWSLVANIGSPIMREYMKPYGLERPENYFKEYCFLAYLLDLDKLREFVYDVYYTFFTNNPFRQETKICQTIQKKTFQRKILTIEKVDSIIATSYWTNLYIMTRYYEVNKKLHPTEIIRLQQRAHTLKMIDSPRDALKYINDYFRELRSSTQKAPVSEPILPPTMAPSANDPAIILPPKIEEVAAAIEATQAAAQEQEQIRQAVELSVTLQARQTRLQERERLTRIWLERYEERAAARASYAEERQACAEDPDCSVALLDAQRENASTRGHSPGSF
jgi:hypothetical protein